jgi:hypothetical protein
LAHLEQVPPEHELAGALSALSAARTPSGGVWRPGQSDPALLIPFVPGERQASFLRAARLGDGRDRLKAWVRGDGAAQALSGAVDPLHHLVLSSRQLDLARALGDGPLARELEGTVARLHAVLSRADLALSVALVPPHQR